MHFGVSKANSHCSYFSEINALLTNITLQTGYPNKMAKDFDTMMLIKGDFQADKLQTRILLEPDCYCINKL